MATVGPHRRPRLGLATVLKTGLEEPRDVTVDDMPGHEGTQVTEPELAVELDSTGRSVGVERETTQEQVIKEPFDPEKIDVATRNPTVGLLLSRIKRGVLELQPGFQRLTDIWGPQAQSRLIESILLRIPLPSFYAAEEGDEKWLVVDGIQRLTTIARFVEPESIGAKPLILTNLEYLKDYEGKRFNGLPGRLQTRFLETEVVLHLIRRGTPQKVMFNIFARINTGGLPLTRQELRHALIPGPARSLLRELAESDAYQNATLHSVSRVRMDDREMVLRFIAFRASAPEMYVRRDFDDFLREAMREINRLDQEQLSRLRDDFMRAMDAAWKIFGQHAFRKHYPGQQRRSPVNKALFEAVSVNLARRTERELQLLCERHELVQEKFSLLLATSPEFVDAISFGTGDIAKVRRRFADVDQILKDVALA